MNIERLRENAERFLKSKKDKIKFDNLLEILNIVQYLMIIFAFICLFMGLFYIIFSFLEIWFYITIVIFVLNIAIYSIIGFKINKLLDNPFNKDLDDFLTQ